MTHDSNHKTEFAIATEILGLETQLNGLSDISKGGSGRLILIPTFFNLISQIPFWY